MNQNLISQLKEGDILVYNHGGFFGWLISFKTWHKVTHVAIYAGNSMSIESKFKEGVGIFKTSTDGLVGVYRPNVKFSFMSGLDWFMNECIGQKYDWKGILGFINVVKGGDRSKQFCSELATRFCRKEGFDPFPNEDSDRVAPFQFTISPLFDKVLQNEIYS